VPDQHAVAATAQVGGGVGEVMAGHARVGERRLEQQPALAGRALGDPREVGVGRVGDVVRAELGARADLERDVLGCEPGRDLGDAAGQLGGVDPPEVGRRDDDRGPVRHGETGERDGLLERPWAVVDPGKDVEVQLGPVGDGVGGGDGRRGRRRHAQARSR
jgi:hypothetical protein